MQRVPRAVLQVGDWRIDPGSGEIARNGESARLEARTMRLLECLVQHAGETVSIDSLLSEVWPDVTVTPDSVYQAVASLRRLLGDDPKHPQYIATVPRVGYRMVAGVRPWTEEEESSRAEASLPGAGARPRIRRLWRLLGAGTALILVVLVCGLLFYSRNAHRSHGSDHAASLPEKSVAVLPFLDLTEGMSNEEFADGMTEELIDKLSKIAGLRVPSATSSFYFKNKRVPVGEIAAKLGVAYVLDGSVRKSGPRLRVAARLVRADNGYVMWSETYDRPVTDLLMVQDDIAGDVTKAMKQSIEAQQ